MNEVYLSSIDIEDFRTFGEFSVTVPATPGLVLVSGTNGLGKSSFFDAIEWALSGKIRRFTPYVSRSGKTVIPDADYLTRNGAERDSHSVTVQFSEGEPVKRSGQETPSGAAVSALLANPGRGEITDLGTHLAMTHFLGQAERQRFTSREADDQWAALKGPSGIDRLELIRTRLRGRQTTLAFSRRIKAEQAIINDIEKNIADWQGWQARLERLRDAVRAGGGLTPEDIQARAASIETDIQRVSSLKLVGNLGETNSQLLARLAGALEAALNQVASHVARLDGAHDLIGRYEQQVLLASTEHPTLVRAAQQLDDTQRAHAAAKERVTLASDALTAQSMTVANAASEIERLEAVRFDLLRRQDLSAVIGEVRLEIEAHNTALIERRRLLTEAGSTIEAHNAAVEEEARFQSVAAMARENLETSARLIELVADASNRNAEVEAAVAAAAAVRDEHDEAVVRRQDLSSTIETTARERAEAERHASAISAAVASIANHIHDDEENCPVCRAHHPAGRLKLLANEAARSSNARVAEIAAREEKLIAEITFLGQRIDDLSLTLSRPAALEPIANRARQTASELLVTLRQALKAGQSDELAELATLRAATAQTELRAAQANLADGQPAALVAAERRASSLSEIEQLTTRLDSDTVRLNGLLTEDKSCAERIAARGVPTPSVDEVGKLLADRRSYLEVAQAQLDELEQASAGAIAAHKLVQEQLTAHENELATAQAVQSNAAMASAQLVERWAALGLAGAPNRPTLDATRDVANGASTELRFLGDRLKELADVNQNVLLEEELAVVTGQMRATGGASAVEDPPAYLKTLQARLAPARAALKLSQDAEEVIDKYTVGLGQRAEAYNREVLRPLNDRILEFNSAMLSTPGASVQFNANKRVDRTDFEMQLRYADKIDDTLLGDRKVPPQVVLSEGQLAANGFSILCAASTAYRWSRWRALLLDDPLQHNDIIHTAAFVDVMRNLVELEGYQLIMSSHDRAESDFIARKFDAAGLACTTVLLTAPSETGVVYDPPAYNAAARRLLDGRTPLASLA
ncbi:AAA family ATPase [Mesorhizobium sp. M0323]|uniref:AAA family ATPase n=1 Tax=Mesorhizobium sp. M0323 TaxID=2956938 RepID=UPI003339FD8D